MHFYHTCLFLLVVSTLTNAINKGYLKGFPGLTAQHIHCHVQINNATKKEHMDQTRQVQRSMQPNPANTSNANNLLKDDNVLPDHIDKGLTNLIFMVIHDITRLVFSNQTSRFPVTSNRGHAYLVIFYIYNANFIVSVPIKNRTKQELLCAYQITYKYLSSCGFKPHLHKMDNKTSKDVEDFIQSQHTTLQYTPPDIHHTNSAKQAICIRITSPQVLPAYQNLSPLPTGFTSPTNATTQSTCFVPAARIPSSLLLRPWKVLENESARPSPLVQ
jgi:hypothetical protein